MAIPQIDLLLHGFGVAYANGKAYGYAAGTTTLVTWYTDAAATIPAANPVTLDATGKATVYCRDRLRIDVQNSAGTSAPGFPIDNLGFGVITPDAWVQVASYGASKNLATINDCLTDVGTTRVVLYFEPGTWTITDNLTIPSTCAVIVDNGTIFAISSGKTLTINGDFSAGVYPIFSGTGNVSFGASSATSAMPEWFGAYNDGTNAATTVAAIIKAVNSCLVVDFGGKGKNFAINAAITLNDGQCIIGGGASITQTTTNTQIFIVSGKNNIEIRGIDFIGYGNDYADSDSSKSVAVYSLSANSNINIHDNNFTDFSYAAIMLYATTNGTCQNNTIVGPGSPILTAITSGKCYGILAETGFDGIFISDNTISQTAQGIRLEVGNNCIVTGNHIYDIVGQHGVYAGSGLSNISIANNSIHDTCLIGIKLQAADTAGADNVNIAIVGNIMDSTGDNGISIQNSNTSGGCAYFNRGITISGNIVHSAGGAGMVVMQTKEASVSNNTMVNNGFGGIELSENTNVSVCSNLIIGSTLSGIRDRIACNYVDIKNNHLINCASADTAGDNFGILIQAGTEYNVSGNYIADANAKMKYGLYLLATGGTNSTFSVTNNTITESTYQAMRIGSAGALRQYNNNYLYGTQGISHNSYPNLIEAASAATLVLPLGHNVVKVTGTTQITTITADGHSGHTVTLVFADTLTVKTGNNIKLTSPSGDFTPVAYSTLMLCSDGINWYEISRSYNV